MRYFLTFLLFWLAIGWPVGAVATLQPVVNSVVVRAVVPPSSQWITGLRRHSSWQFFSLTHELRFTLAGENDWRGRERPVTLTAIDNHGRQKQLSAVTDQEGSARFRIPFYLAGSTDFIVEDDLLRIVVVDAVLNLPNRLARGTIGSGEAIPSLFSYEGQKTTLAAVFYPPARRGSLLARR